MTGGQELAAAALAALDLPRGLTFGLAFALPFAMSWVMPAARGIAVQRAALE